MAVVYLLCGKIGCGKSTYAKSLKQKNGGVILSCDELMLSLFDEQLFDRHQEILDKASAYLFDMAAELIEAGVTVILDFGFWTKESRRAARAFFGGKGIETRLIYIDIPESQRARNLEKRNMQIVDKSTTAYRIDGEMKAILDKKFEEPAWDEVDEIVAEIIR